MLNYSFFSVNFDFSLVLGGLAQHAGYGSEYTDLVPPCIQLTS